ncbi:SDR family oxidoreductase [Paenibacillus piri]|uniref:SDR family oxidoreductase n=1 Tax=Paenibacillus piri TaxID=2547395 RepID=UPI001FE95B23|nr:SDR family oxidoreductase [Paenibacillus piri]
MGTSPSFEETCEEDFDRLIAVNVKAPFFLVQQSLGRLRDGGRIINISSGVSDTNCLSAYHGLQSNQRRTKYIHPTPSSATGSMGITVNAVMPGIIDTDVNASWLHTPDGRKSAIEMAALGRIGEPSDIADIVAFTDSPDGRWVTGQLIDGTGGSHL